MAIYHLNAKVISRAAGRSATAAAAYRSGDRLVDERTGRAFDYTKRKDVSYRTVLAPDDAPSWMLVRDRLWNACESAERRKDAQVAREIEVALPIELSRREHIRLLRRFVREELVARGMVADLALHAKRGNPHAHVLLTTRSTGPDGFGPKVREWNDVDLLKDWRERWAEACNASLKRAGFEHRIDHRTLAAQGIDRTPGSHHGPAAGAIDRKGRESRRINEYITTKENEMNEALKMVRESEVATPSKKKIGFPAQITVLDSQTRKRCNAERFTQPYVQKLVDTFGDRCSTIQEVQTDRGLCQRLELKGGGAVRDFGDTVFTEGHTHDEVCLAVELAKLKGWKRIQVAGPPKFREAVFLQAVISGAYKANDVGGYAPTDENLQVIAQYDPPQSALPKTDFTVTVTHLREAESGGQESSGDRTQRYTPF